MSVDHQKIYAATRGRQRPPLVPPSTPPPIFPEVGISLLNRLIRVGEKLIVNQIRALRRVLAILKTDIEINSSFASLKDNPAQNQDIFIVHGRNEGIVQTVARVLEKS